MRRLLLAALVAALTLALPSIASAYTCSYLSIPHGKSFVTVRGNDVSPGFCEFFNRRTFHGSMVDTKVARRAAPLVGIWKHRRYDRWVEIRTASKTERRLILAAFGERDPDWRRVR